MGYATSKPESQEKRRQKVSIHALLSVVSAVNCGTCAQNGKGFCSGLHKQLDPKETIFGHMECKGGKYEPVIPETTIKDIVNIWVYSNPANEDEFKGDAEETSERSTDLLITTKED